MEITLYERDGCPVAYIADDPEHSIYTWDGMQCVTSLMKEFTDGEDIISDGSSGNNI